MEGWEDADPSASGINRLKKKLLVVWGCYPDRI